ncbi:MAG: helix-turn-helix domain-containing protein [Ekhidna sp.]|nr:helix-turn-helix domain-containing protein [Ekhidna sp.]
MILIDETNLYELIEQISKELIAKLSKEPERWLNAGDAMERLGISSPTTLQKYRDEGKIRFSQPSRKVILYDRFSINDFLEENARDTF